MIKSLIWTNFRRIHDTSTMIFSDFTGSIRALAIYYKHLVTPRDIIYSSTHRICFIIS